MRIPKHLFAFLLILFLIPTVAFTSLGNHTAYACSCMQPLPLDEELPGYFSVFSGKVVKITEDELPRWDFSQPGYFFVVFNVDTVWKGYNSDKVIITTSQSSASCGFNFEEEEEYIVYATLYDWILPDLVEVSLCSRTGLLSDATKDLQELGPGHSMKSENKSNISSPLKQLKSGIPSEEIQCNEGLYRALKHDNTPVCISEHSVTKLAERGWLNTEPQEICFDQMIDGQNVTTCS